MAKKLSLEDIDETINKDIVVQKYAEKEVVEGVRVVELKNFITEDGCFMELSRLERGVLQAFNAEGFEAKQINLAKSAKGSIKAWHIHFEQEDVWFVAPESKLLVGLVDLRKNSSTRGVKMRLVMGGGKTELLYIPRGVAHGYANIGPNEAQIIYFVNEQFKREAPDERRLAWDYFGAEFWQVKKE